MSVPGLIRSSSENGLFGARNPIGIVNNVLEEERWLKSQQLPFGH